jgi:hypothetical protein
VNATNPRPDKRKGRRILMLMALFAVSPIVASYVTYYWFVPDKRVNYGELLAAGPAPAVVGTRENGAPFSLSELQGQWVLLVVSGADCSDACARALYATRQARTIQGREQDRVVRAWLRPATAPATSPQLLAEHQGLVVARAGQQALARLPLATDGKPTILLLDTRGNIVLRYGSDPDIKRFASDLSRLLRASQIGQSGLAGMLKYAFVRDYPCAAALLGGSAA